MAPSWRSWVVAHFVATFAHFAHNAWNLEAYPGLPSDWTPAGVLASWLLVAAPGAVGYILQRRGHPKPARAALLIFGVLGFAGFLHFLFAPASHHSMAMLAAIGAEAITGAGLITALLLPRDRRGESVNEHAKQLTSLRNKCAKVATNMTGGQRERLERHVAALDAALASTLSRDDRAVLASLLDRTQAALAKLVPGTSQHTLLTRRAAALEDAVGR